MFTANATPSFKLKSPTEYFADAKTLALLNAALAGDAAKAKQLVVEGATPNDEGPKGKLNQNRIRLLHYAIAANNASAVRILLAVGADPELNAKGFGPAFAFAMLIGNTDMLTLLLDLRPIASLSKDTLLTMLFEGIDMPNPQRNLTVLLKYGAPIDLPDEAGYTILMRALGVYDFDLAEWLLQQGASVNVESHQGVSPAYSVQDNLARAQPGTESHQKLLRLKSLMEAKGAVFPAPSPEEIKAKRSIRH